MSEEILQIIIRETNKKAISKLETDQNWINIDMIELKVLIHKDEMFFNNFNFRHSLEFYYFLQLQNHQKNQFLIYGNTPQAKVDLFFIPQCLEKDSKTF